MSLDDPHLVRSQRLLDGLARLGVTDGAVLAACDTALQSLRGLPAPTQQLLRQRLARLQPATGTSLKRTDRTSSSGGGSDDTTCTAIQGQTLPATAPMRHAASHVTRVTPRHAPNTAPPSRDVTPARKWRDEAGGERPQAPARRPPNTLLAHRKASRRREARQATARAMALRRLRTGPPPDSDPTTHHHGG